MTDQTGIAIAGVTVEVINPVTSATVGTTTTTDFGTYALDLEAGTYYIRVTPPMGSRFVPFTSPNRSITDDTIINVVLVSPGLVVLSGQVLDANGQGIAGQRVELRSGSYEIFQVTDAAGNYRFQTARGSYHLNISGSNQASAARSAPGGYSLTTKLTPLTLTENMVSDLQLLLKRGVVHVQDSRGNLAANTKIEVSNPNNFNLRLGSFAAYGHSHYRTNSAFTNARGDAMLWLFPTEKVMSYTFTITPPAGTPFVIFTVSNITVTEDKYEMIVLQYDDAPPASRAVLNPGKLYGRPVTVIPAAIGRTAGCAGPPDPIEWLVFHPVARILWAKRYSSKIRVSRRKSGCCM